MDEDKNKEGSKGRKKNVGMKKQTILREQQPEINSLLRN